jgi:hypothetical protein
MTKQHLSKNKETAIGQLCQMQPGDQIIYSVGSSPGPHASAMLWLSGRGGIALVQSVAEPCRGNMQMRRPFIYIAQRTAAAMPKKDVQAAFSTKRSALL